MTEDNRNITPRTDSSISRRQEDLINRGLELARKINSPDQNKPAEYKYEFVRKWGSQGSEDGQFNWPMGVALDGDGNVYVADYQGHRIQVFNSEGNFLRKWESIGSEDGQLKPWGLAIDNDDNVYVADWNNTDCSNNQIQFFDSQGNFLRKWGSEGSEDGQFDKPAGVALDGDGNVYVADWNNHRIQVFNSEGNFLRKWGSRGSEDGQFDRPYGLAIGSDGNVYVADTGYYRIQVFKPARLT